MYHSIMMTSAWTRLHTEISGENIEPTNKFLRTIQQLGMWHGDMSVKFKWESLNGWSYLVINCGKPSSV